MYASPKSNNCLLFLKMAKWRLILKHIDTAISRITESREKSAGYKILYFSFFFYKNLK